MRPRDRTTRTFGLRLQWLIIAALETGCRRGELLALRWADITPRSAHCSSGLLKQEPRRRPAHDRCRYRRVLRSSWRWPWRSAKAKETARPVHHVFGDAIGARIRNIKRAWATAVLKAHRHQPEWSKGTLAAASRAHLNSIDLQSCDLRHEAGCRWLEAGLPLHHIQEMLGHTNLAQTSTYLHASEFGLMDSMKRFDESRKGKPLANIQAIDHEPVCQSGENDRDKTFVH